MRAHPVFRLLIIAAAVAMPLSGCQSKPEATTVPAEPAETIERPTPRPTPTPRVDVDVEQPGGEPVPSVEVGASDLPTDLVELNERGYLKDVFFDTDEYSLGADARRALAANADWLRDYPSVEIRIEGHADERNTREYNLALGERRAAAVADYLASLGVGRDRMTTISYGEERPFAMGGGEAVWQLNRRAHIEIVGR